MAHWQRFNLVFIEPPTKEVLQSFTGDLQDEDYDAPAVSIDGCRDYMWRSPYVDCEEKLRELCEKHGIECKFKLWNDGDPEPYEWEYSYSELTEAKENILHLRPEDRKTLICWMKEKSFI